MTEKEQAGWIGDALVQVEIKMPEECMPTKKELQREQTKKKILQVALREFSEHGYHDARLGIVAAKAGITQGLITKRFGGKCGLLIEVIRNQILPVFDAIPENASLREIALMVVHDVKDKAQKRDIRYLFAANFLMDPALVPGEAMKLMRERFIESKVFDVIRNSGVDEKDAFHVLIDFLKNVIGSVCAYCEVGIPLPPDEAFLRSVWVLNGALEEMHSKTHIVKNPSKFDLLQIIRGICVNYELLGVLDFRRDVFDVYCYSDWARNLLNDIEDSSEMERLRYFVCRAVFLEDLEDFLRAVRKDVVLEALKERKVYQFLTRILIHGKPKKCYVRFTKLGDNTEKLLLGFVNMEG